MKSASASRRWLWLGECATASQRSSDLLSRRFASLGSEEKSNTDTDQGAQHEGAGSRDEQQRSD